MPSVFSSIVLLLISLLLSACGGSSDDPAPVTPEEPVIETPEPVTTSTINGTIKVASNIIKDGDLNDRNTPLIDNSSILKAQQIPNVVTVQGFATASPTNGLNGFSDDRFYFSTDTDDFYLSNLQANQVVQLQSIKYNPQDNSGSEEGDNSAETVELPGDLDLSLINYETGETLSSFDPGEFDTLTIPVAGVYYINVHASRDAARYVLSIRQPNAGAIEAFNSSSTQAADHDFIENELIIQFNDQMQTANIAPELGGLSLRHSGKSRPTLAKLHDTIAAASSLQHTPSNLQSLAERYPQAYEKLMTIRKMKTLSRAKHVKTVSLNYWRKPMRIPSDPLYQYQWHYPAMSLPQAWDITTGTPTSGDVIVAVIDTGIVSSHPDLKNKLVPGYDFIADNQNSRDAEPGIDNNPEDPGDSTELGASSWHGTHVAGTVAAESNNGIGVAGVSWGAKIMPLRALGQFGGTTYDIMQAMNFAAGLDNDSGSKPAKPADIINLSLGGGGFSQTEANLYKKIHDLGIVIVAAAGNENTNIAAYPASYPGVISVSATNFNKQRAPYSNFGPHVDIAAPGGDMTVDANRDGFGDGVASTFADDSSGSPQPNYALAQGTSMATPHVAGMIALMKAVNPALTAENIITMLETDQLTDPAGVFGRDDVYGYGNANALKAVQAALNFDNGTEVPEPPAILQASPASLSFSPDSLSSNLVISNEGSGTTSLLSVINDNSWLSITEKTSSNPDILALFTIQADPENLSSGFYFGTLEFHFDNAPSLEVSVNLTVGIDDTGGKLSRIYVNLYDIVEETVVDWTEARENLANELVFTFRDVPQGQYVIVAGTDIDNDFKICQLAEGCAVYPPSSQISPIDTQIPGTVGLEMTANILRSQEISSINSTSQFAATRAVVLPENESRRSRTRIIQK